MMWLLLVILQFLLGLSITSRISKNHSLATAFPLGFFLFSWMSFLFSLALGFSQLSLILSVILSLVILLLLKPKLNLSELKFPDATILCVSFLVFLLLNSQALIIYNQRGSMYTSSRDLEYHASIISLFASSRAISFQDPVLPSSPLNYYFLSDFASAVLMKLGTPLLDSILIPNVLLSSFLVLCAYRLGLLLTKNKTAAVLLALLIVFNSNLGFVDFFSAYSHASPEDKLALASDPLTFPFAYGFERGIAIAPNFADYMLNQRAFLAGLSVLFLLLIFFFESKPNTQSYALLGVLTGLLPLYHIHSFAFMFAVVFVFFLFDLKNYRAYASFALPALLLASPQLILLSGSATKLRFEPGWIAKYDDKEWQVRTGEGLPGLAEFWLKNAGPLLILGAIGLYFADDRIRKLALLAMFLFILLNVVILHPYKQDNRKLFFFVGLIVSIPASLLLARLLKRRILWPVFLILLLLLVSGAVLEYASMTTKHREFLAHPGDEVRLCAIAANLSPPDSLFLDSGIGCLTSLGGRRTFVRLDAAGKYWLDSHGMKYSDAQGNYSRMLMGDDSLIQENNITHVLLGTSSQGYRFDKEHFISSYRILWTDNNSYFFLVNRTAG